VHDVVCNGCDSSTILGMRWECTFCDKYILCQNCKSITPGHPNNHVFKPIAYPANIFELLGMFLLYLFEL
jgi:hypothetical protein